MARRSRNRSAISSGERPAPSVWPCASRRSSSSASKPFAVVSERTKFRVEAQVLGLARSRHPREVRLHQVGQAERATKPPPPPARQAERPQQRIEKPDIPEPDLQRSPRDLARTGDRERQRFRIRLHPVAVADILVARLQPLRRALVVAAEDQPLIGVAGRAGFLGEMHQADGDGEIRPQRQPLALRPFGHEHPPADILARRLQERIGRMQHGHLDEARAGRIVERTQAGGERRHQRSRAGTSPPCGERVWVRGVERRAGRRHPSPTPPHKGEGRARALLPCNGRRGGREPFAPISVVIAGLDPAIHSVAVEVLRAVTEWIAGSSPGMTTVLKSRMPLSSDAAWKAVLHLRHQLVARHLELAGALLAPRLVVGDRRRLLLAGGEVLHLHLAGLEFVRAGDDGGGRVAPVGVFQLRLHAGGAEIHLRPRLPALRRSATILW